MEEGATEVAPLAALEVRPAVEPKVDHWEEGKGEAPRVAMMEAQVAVAVATVAAARVVAELAEEIMVVWAMVDSWGGGKAVMEVVQMEARTVEAERVVGLGADLVVVKEAAVTAAEMEVVVAVGATGVEQVEEARGVATEEGLVEDRVAARVAEERVEMDRMY
jgi:hypothetical protein